MEAKHYIILCILGIPFSCLTLMYVVLLLTNKASTGEIKMILPPETFLKVLAVFVVASVVFALAILEIINESTVAALLGSIITGVLGAFGKKGAQEER